MSFQQVPCWCRPLSNTVSYRSNSLCEIVRNHNALLFRINDTRPDENPKAGRARELPGCQNRCSDQQQTGGERVRCTASVALQQRCSLLMTARSRAYDAAPSWPKRLPAPLRRRSRPLYRSGQPFARKPTTASTPRYLRKEGIHVVSDSIANFMADNPDTI